MWVAPAATCWRTSARTTSCGHDEEAPVVDGRDRAVAAEVQAAAAGLDVADELEPVVSLQLRVLLERRQGRRGSGRESSSGAERRARRAVGGCRQWPARGRSSARARSTSAASISPPMTESAMPRQQVVGVEGRVEAVEADVAGGVDWRTALGDGHAEAERGVHRHRDRDERRGGRASASKGSTAMSSTRRREARALEKRRAATRRASGWWPSS